MATKCRTKSHIRSNADPFNCVRQNWELGGLEINTVGVHTSLHSTRTTLTGPLLHTGMCRVRLLTD